MSHYQLERVDGDAGSIHVRLAGELDLTNAHELEARLLRIASPGMRLVLDLTRVVFVDSAALHVLFRLARRGDDEQRLSLILEPTAPITETISIVGLGQVARIVSSSAALPSDTPRN